MKNIIFDMETNDPDDYITLLLLLGHPDVNLKAVTITPGSAYQVGLVEKTLKIFQKDIPIGAFNIEHPKTCVSDWHENAYGQITPSNNAQEGFEVLIKYCDENTTLITGAPLKNLGKALDSPDFKLGTLVAQGGFAGEGVVPAEKQLEKFKGRKTCPTFNLNGDIPAAFKALATDKIDIRYFVSKNVCHGVVYDTSFHHIISQYKDLSMSLSLIYKGMEYYLTKNPLGKMLHDPLAACCALDLSIGTWAEVEIFREKGEWGAKLQENTKTWIITDYDHVKFVDTFTKT
ncbi:MAG: nucleoside hydrolase [Raineya sp.]|jgi:pyrimidine-specific ribonucleoside hydrolase|nr:nucleoside hydrolase [Raineya sp.]